MAWSWTAGRDLATLEPLWRQAHASAPHSVFQQFEFARAWIECFGADDVIVLHADTPPLLLAFVERGGELRPLGEGLFDYFAPVGLAPAGQLAQAAALLHRRAWHAAGCSAAVAAGRGAAFWRQCGAEPEPFAAAPLRPAAAGDPYSQHPRTAGRWRRAREAGLSCALETDPVRRLDLLEWMLRQKRAALAARGATNVLGMREEAWLRRMISMYPALSEVWSLRHHGAPADTPLAALLCWVQTGQRCAYTICFESRAAVQSPGILLLWSVLCCTMREGRDLDFMTGEQPFKLRFATASVPLVKFSLLRA